MIKEIRISNFLSFKEETVRLTDSSTVLVGINGSGKSNFLKVLRLLHEGIAGIGLKAFVYDLLGGMDNIRFKSIETTNKPVEIRYKLDGKVLGKYGGVTFAEDVIYTIELHQTPNTSNYYVREEIKSDGGFLYLKFENGTGQLNELKDTASNKNKTSLVKYHDFTEPTELALSKMFDTNRYFALSTIRKAIAEMVVYDYFDTTPQSAIRKPMLPTSGKRLSPNGANLSQILNTIKINHKTNYNIIIQKLNDVNARFKGFDFNFIGGNIELMLEEDKLNSSIHVSSISDGTLRYLCLLAILYNPQNGSLICIDEPEAGLHPDMISGIGQAINEVSENSRIIIATHSAHLLNSFNLENINVFEKEEYNASKVYRYHKDDFDGWYEEYSPGTMWRNGDLGGNRW